MSQFFVNTVIRQKMINGQTERQPDIYIDKSGMPQLLKLSNVIIKTQALKLIKLNQPVQDQLSSLSLADSRGLSPSDGQLNVG